MTSKVLSRPTARAAIADGQDWRAALERALDRITIESAPDLVLLFASAHYAPEFRALVGETRRRTGARTLAGCSGNGVVGSGCEIEDRPGLSLLALWCPEATFHPIRLHQEMLPLPEDAAHLPALADLASADVRAWFVFADPYRMDVQAAITGLGDLYPGVPVVGGMASAHANQRRSWIFFDDQVYDEGGVAIALTGPYHVLPVIAQGCDPIGEPWTITGTSRNTLTSISNRPALDVMQATLASLPLVERERAEQSLVVGFAADEYKDEFTRGDFLVRGVLGVDREQGTITVGDLPRIGQTIQFQVRDAAAADVELHQLLAETRALLHGTTPFAGILCTCNGRGKDLFGVCHHDASAVQAAFGDLPLAGLFCNGEIGPLGKRNRNFLHAFTASLFLLIRDDEGAENA